MLKTFFYAMIQESLVPAHFFESLSPVFVGEASNSLDSDLHLPST